MAELYACKYRILIGNDEKNESVFVPVGTVFVVDYIAKFIALKPAVKTPNVKQDWPIMVTPELLNFAFTKNDTLI